MATNDGFKDKTSVIFLLVSAVLFLGVALLAPVLKTLFLVFGS